MRRTPYEKGFRQLWGATAVSLLGSQVSLVALPLAAVVSLRATVGEVALLAAAGTAPFLLFGLPAGVWMERWSLRRLMVLADLLRAAVLVSVPVAYLLDALSMAQLYLVAFVVGTAGVFFDVAALSVLPSLVPEGGRLAVANSRLEVARASAQTSGPALGGWLVHLLTAPIAIVADAASYVVSALLLRGVPDTRLVEPGRRRGALVTEVVAGLRYCLTHPYIRPLVLGAAWINFWVEALMALIVTFAVRSLHLTAAEIGLVLGASNLGYLLGSVAVPHLVRRIGVGRAILGGVVLHGGLALVTLARNGAPLVWLTVGFTLFTVGGALWNVNAVSLRQLTTEPAMLARMNASNRFLIWGTMPLGAAAGGALASVAGTAAAVTVAGCAVPLVVVPMAFTAIARVRDMPERPGALPQPLDAAVAAT